MKPFTEDDKRQLECWVVLDHSNMEYQTLMGVELKNIVELALNASATLVLNQKFVNRPIPSPKQMTEPPNPMVDDIHG